MSLGSYLVAFEVPVHFIGAAGHGNKGVLRETEV